MVSNVGPVGPVRKPGTSTSGQPNNQGNGKSNTKKQQSAGRTKQPKQPNSIFEQLKKGLNNAQANLNNAYLNEVSQFKSNPGLYLGTRAAGVGGFMPGAIGTGLAAAESYGNTLLNGGSKQDALKNAGITAAATAGIGKVGSLAGKALSKTPAGKAVNNLVNKTIDNVSNLTRKHQVAPATMPIKSFNNNILPETMPIRSFNNNIPPAAMPQGVPKGAGTFNEFRAVHGSPGKVSGDFLDVNKSGSNLPEQYGKAAYVSRDPKVGLQYAQGEDPRISLVDVPLEDKDFLYDHPGIKLRDQSPEVIDAISSYYRTQGYNPNQINEVLANDTPMQFLDNLQQVYGDRRNAILDMAGIRGVRATQPINQYAIFNPEENARFINYKNVTPTQFLNDLRKNK